ncbi:MULTISPECIES: murein hydrolase activator EnvC family protein [unclassified Arthrobacter]|uniref:murein hydrolase activator EnvC family protein n=1 Tax=unclassified Arthrobacter TaxID=235627 RepID=UPI0014924925|nr:MULTISPECIES: M23 family metallopeptidase [unclassified Arthrobacter]MBE0009314.1 M23 family peptidase [Arthrobacter sp. AET 35A]NOJ63149.1 M23 family metallopeptidase [Arthrobacter sp. 147(2020)]
MTSGSRLHRSTLVAALLVTALVITGSSAPSPPREQGVAAPGQEYAPPWSWPLSPTPVVLRQFDRPEQPWLPGHRGVDLAVEETARVNSPAAGRVVFAGWVVDRPVVTVDHGGGVLSSFEPVTAVLDRGQAVQDGQQIGTLDTGAGSHGASSHCPSSCLHWGVRVDGEYVNPLNYVTDRRPSILLPLRGP